MVFDEADCDRMERALLRAYRLFMHSGRLSTENLSITKATLSRSIMHAMERGERDESRLAMYAVNTFTTYSNDIVARDLMSIGGMPSRRHATERAVRSRPDATEAAPARPRRHCPG